MSNSHTANITGGEANSTLNSQKNYQKEQELAL